MEEYGSDQPRNGFQSRDLGGKAPLPQQPDRSSDLHIERPVRPAQPNNGPVRMPATYHAPKQMRQRRPRRPGSGSRIHTVILWMRARGRKRLIRDGILFIVLFSVLYGTYLWMTLPNISDPRSLIASQSSVITDRNGVELYRLYGDENRTFVDGSQIPVNLQNAVVAIEDERFYNRGCLDIRAIARVFLRFGQAGGASTLTRQLARNALDLKQENIISRKLKEIILGCQLEAHYSKTDLLNLYLNWIPFGQNIYGVELASKTYFNISAKDLTLAESAVLASLPQRPSYFNPYGSHARTTVTPQIEAKVLSGQITKASQIPDADITIGLLGNVIGTGATTVQIGGRADQVLQNMQNLGFIKEADRLTAQKELRTLKFTPYRENIRAAHFVLWVKSQVEQLLGGNPDGSVLNQGGLTIETTLDWNMQQAAEQLIAAKKAALASVYNINNIAMISVQNGTNEILTYVGNTDYNDTTHGGKVDMAQSPRQPGSSFKPFVYATAFTKGYGPGTVLYDVPTTFGTDKPENFDGTFWGLTTVRKALAGSRNIPAIKAFFLAGEEGPILAQAASMGVVTPTTQKQQAMKTNKDYQYGWPLALGAAETPLSEMVQGYATFADGGISKPLISIKKITDRRGNILFESTPDAAGSQALDPRVAYEITSILSDTAARPNQFWQDVLSVPGFQAAGKTGTSNKCLVRADAGGCTERRPSDLWTMGYTPDLVTGIWMGNADSSPLAAKAESLSQASPIWKDFMVKAHKLLKNPITNFTVPSGVVQPQVSTLSGQLPTDCTPIDRRLSDVFLQENAPSLPDPACVKLTVDKVTGLLASTECPADAQEERSFFSAQEVLASRFPQWQKSVIDWAKKKMTGYDPVTNTYPTVGTGGLLPLPLAPTDSCTLALTPGRQTKPTVSISYPLDNGTASYPSFQPRLNIGGGAGVREVDYELDGKPAGVMTQAPFTAPINVPKSIQQSGQHTLTVKLIDQYYNTATATATFGFQEDHNKPTVHFTSPVGSLTAKSGETLTLQASASDEEGGIKYVQFYVDTRLLTTKPQAPYQLDWPQTLVPGTYNLRAVATDLAGNTEEDSVELTITN